MDIHLVSRNPARVPAPSSRTVDTSPPDTKSGLVFHPQAPVREDGRPRHVSKEATGAQLLLVHALEYLADARGLPNGRISQLDPAHPDVYALLLLMEAKFQIYACCPVIERRRSTLAGLFSGPERRKNR